MFDHQARWPTWAQASRLNGPTHEAWVRCSVLHSRAALSNLVRSTIRIFLRPTSTIPAFRNSPKAAVADSRYTRNLSAISACVMFSTNSPSARSNKRHASLGINCRNDVASKSSKTSTNRRLTRSNNLRVTLGYSSISASNSLREITRTRQASAERAAQWYKHGPTQAISPNTAGAVNCEMINLLFPEVRNVSTLPLSKKNKTSPVPPGWKNTCPVGNLCASLFFSNSANRDSGTP
jgi:hypothetical protein